MREHDDDSFEKDEFVEKTCNFIDNYDEDDKENIIEELEVLKQKGFINLNTSIDDVASTVIDDISLTKAGIDYLTILEEDFRERAIYNENILKINQILCDINENSEKLNKKSLLDKIAQGIGISSDVFSSISALGAISQGIIPIITKISTILVQ